MNRAEAQASQSIQQSDESLSQSIGYRSAVLVRFSSILEGIARTLISPEASPSLGSANARMAEHNLLDPRYMQAAARLTDKCGA